MPPDLGIGSTFASVLRNYGTGATLSRVSVAKLDPSTGNPSAPDSIELWQLYGEWRDATSSELVNDLFTVEDAIFDIPARVSLLTVSDQATMGVTPRASDFITIFGSKYRVRTVVTLRAADNEPYGFSLALQRIK